MSAVTGYSADYFDYWIGQIAKRSNATGPEAMQNRRHTTSYRPPPALSPTLQEELRRLRLELARRNDYWTRQDVTGQDVTAWMTRWLGRPVTYQLGRSYLVRLQGLRHNAQSPRPRHVLAEAAQQESFKKVTTARAAGGHRVSARHGRAVGER